MNPLSTRRDFIRRSSRAATAVATAGAFSALRWAGDIEDRIASTVHELVRLVRA